MCGIVEGRVFDLRLIFQRSLAAIRLMCDTYLEGVWRICALPPVVVSAIHQALIGSSINMDIYIYIYISIFIYNISSPVDPP